MFAGNIKILAQKQHKTFNISIYRDICPKTRGVKDIVGSLGSRLVSGSYHENKVSVVMEMA
jgi:hypothetical protein